MDARCKKCGKPLHDPMSIARGMGPKCAGIRSVGKSFRASRSLDGGSAYSAIEEGRATVNLLSFIDERQGGVPENLSQFPPDLVDLVLSAPVAGSIAARGKLYSHRKQNGAHAGIMLKQIRRMCIEHRLLFWSGLSMKFEPIPCIPCGENDWKLGEDGRVMSKGELVAYLSRYGIIGREQTLTLVQATTP